MADLSKLTVEEMVKDRDECEEDIFMCNLGLMAGIKDDGTRPLTERISMNKAIIAVIDGELARRKEAETCRPEAA